MGLYRGKGNQILEADEPVAGIQINYHFLQSFLTSTRVRHQHTLDNVVKRQAVAASIFMAEDLLPHTRSVESMRMENDPTSTKLQ